MSSVVARASPAQRVTDEDQKKWKSQRRDPGRKGEIVVRKLVLSRRGSALSQAFLGLPGSSLCAKHKPLFFSVMPACDKRA